MRTLLVGLIGGALVFTFFWYTGATGPITLPGVGTLESPITSVDTPAERVAAVRERLSALPPQARAMRARMSPSEPIVRQTSAPQIYAGQLIAKPRETAPAPAPGDSGASAAADEESEAAFEGRLTARSLAARRVAPGRVSMRGMPTAALRAANEVGVVDTTVGGRLMVVNVDYDLMNQVLEEQSQSGDATAPAPQPAAPNAPSAVRRLSPLEVNRALELRPSVAAPVTDDAAAPVARAISRTRPLAFNAGEALRERAMRDSGRQLRWARPQCPDSVDADTLRQNPQIGVACAIARLRESGEFEYVEPNYIATNEFARRPGPTMGVVEPDDPLFAYQWNFHDQGGADSQSAGGAGFQDYWTRGRQRGSRDVVVAVVDSGLDMEHPDIRNSPNLAPGVDMISVPFYANDGDGRDLDPSDPGDICDRDDPNAENSYHGTHVAGTIGASATNDGQGVAGGAWNVTIVPVRALGRCGGLQSDINDAIRWAAGVEPVIIETAGGVQTVENEHPADVINLSLGFVAPDGCPRSTQEAINDAVAAGAVVVAAAGNAGIDVEGYGPSGCDNVVTVAAGDALGALTYYSNWGDKVDIMAPGGDLRVDADGDGRPDGVLSTKRTEHCIDPVTDEPVDQCNYSYENGTSMAAPHVSAALALLKSEHPGRTSADLVDLLENIARSPRTLDQCEGPCADTPGGMEIDGEPGMCHRECGQGLLDLSLAVGR